ncbi:MAG TPA: response regulator transcription factor [Polyangia bacterium]|nr:response regulator transcription factor [Polyangia bacterium]
MTVPNVEPAGTLVAIVEDDDAIAEGLALNLRLQGYRTETIGDAETALARVTEAAPALVLLDITLPKQSGLWVLERLREADNHVPVIVLSARQDEFDKVAALHLGADDYVTKPFALAELLARIAGLLRRSRLSQLAAASALALAKEERAPVGDVMVRFGDIVLDPVRHTVVRAGASVPLTPREFELLAFLCDSGGRVFSREELVRKVWGLSHAGQARTVDNFVAQLRAKLETDPDRPKHLLTVRGSGYRFVP